MTAWGWWALAVSLLGLLLRVEHALTFDHVNRASDYAVHLPAVRWTQQHWTAFFHTTEISYQIRSYPPLWYFGSALILKLTDSERALAILSLIGFVLRHSALVLALRQAIPERPLSRLTAITIHALLPLGVLIDGKVNPESLHSGIFSLALYFLWRMERQAQTPAGMSIGSAAWFGGLAGLALLAKITGGMLVAIGGLTFAWQAVRWFRRSGLRSTWTAVAAPALVAGVMWCLVAGWWAGTNFSRFGHPFPHVWALEDPAANVILSEPAPYRRPLGWALPIEWQQYWRFPLLRTPQNPRPNFWAVEVTGTWSDIYNRGFCRLKGSGDTSYVWGARNGFMSQHSDAWDVSHRCVHWFAAMLHVGVWLTAASVLSVLWCLWQSLKTWGARGTLVFSLMPLVGTASGLWLALAYPYDNIAALNPRYLLSQVMPMSVCLGLGLAQVEALGGRNGWRGAVARWASWLALGPVALIGLMLVYERFGW